LADVTSLPTPLTTVIGRHDDITAVVTLLRRPDVRLLTDGAGQLYVVGVAADHDTESTIQKFRLPALTG
jgi:hypothetical protein